MWDASLMDISELNLEEFPSELEEQAEEIETLWASWNNFTSLPPWMTIFTNLKTLDLSRNYLPNIPLELTHLPSLKSLSLKSNQLTDVCFPKTIGFLSNLEQLNLSGNLLTHVPPAVFSMENLQELFLGDNNITLISCNIAGLKSLEGLYLGGNKIQHIPPQLGSLVLLTILNLAENQLETLPSSLGNLVNMRSLSLHGNQLQTLPQEIVKLENLEELSLRNNPLVVRFVHELEWHLPSLLELAGRSVLNNRIEYNREILPGVLVDYLNSSHKCVNPRCAGVYFTHHVEHVKFVDFCGKYRLPLQQFLCSPKCSVPPTTASRPTEEDERVRRVLLG